MPLLLLIRRSGLFASTTAALALLRTPIRVYSGGVASVMPAMSSNGGPTSMTAIEIRQPGGPDVLTPVRRPVPEPGAGEVLIRVAAAGVNRPDCLQRQGLYPPPPGASDLPGLELVRGLVAELQVADLVHLVHVVLVGAERDLHALRRQIAVCLSPAPIRG